MDGLSPISFEEARKAHSDVTLNDYLKKGKESGMFKYINGQLVKQMRSDDAVVTIWDKEMWKHCENGQPPFGLKQTTVDVLKIAYGDTFDITWKGMDDGDDFDFGSCDSRTYYFSKKKAP